MTGFAGLFSSTLKVAFGSASMTVPSSSIKSSFGILISSNCQKVYGPACFARPPL
nr:MAG TPA: hypothetical protein [Caudoviricetes sp.]